MIRNWLHGVLASLLGIVLLATGASQAEAAYMTVTARQGTFGSVYSSDITAKDIGSAVAKLKFTFNCTAGSVEVSYRSGGLCNESVTVGREFFTNNGYVLPLQLKNISNKAQRTGIIVEALNGNGTSLAKSTFIVDQYAFIPVTIRIPVANQLLNDEVVVEWDKLAGTQADYYTATVTHGERKIFESPEISKLKPSKYTIPKASITSQVTGSTQLKVSVLAYQKNTQGDVNVGNGERLITYMAPGGSTGGTPAHPFNLQIRGKGTVNGNPGPYVAQGTVVTLTAVPDRGYAFLGWNGDYACNHTNPVCTVTIGGPVDALAKFGFAPYQEAGGMIVIEAEDTQTFKDILPNQNSPFGTWEIIDASKTSYVQGATGGKYIKNAKTSGGARELLYRFKINQTGYYQLHLRAHKNPTEGADTGNDAFVWVYGEEGMENSDGYFFEGGTRVNFDADVDALHQPAKIAGGSDQVWSWAEWVYVDAKRAPVYRFEAGKTYTLELSNRSVGFDVDRIVFRDINRVPGVSAKDYSIPQSSVFGPVNPNIPPITFGTTRVQTIERVNVRQTPGLSGTLVFQTKFNEKGTIIDGPKVANNFTWWRIRYDNGMTGWSGEDNLELIPSGGVVAGAFDSKGITAYSHISAVPNLTVGMTDPGVAAIQRYLNANGFMIGSAPGQPGSVGYESNYFGPGTQRALAAFQASRGISPANGAFGPQTRAAMSSN